MQKTKSQLVADIVTLQQQVAFLDAVLNGLATSIQPAMHSHVAQACVNMATLIEPEPVRQVVMEALRTASRRAGVGHNGQGEGQ